MRDLGDKAWLHPVRGQTHCAFCCEQQYDKERAANNGREITKKLLAFKTFGEDELEKRLAIIRRWKGDAEAKEFLRRTTLSEGRKVAKAIIIKENQLPGGSQR